MTIYATLENTWNSHNSTPIDVPVQEGDVLVAAKAYSSYGCDEYIYPLIEDELTLEAKAKLVGFPTADTSKVINKVHPFFDGDKPLTIGYAWDESRPEPGDTCGTQSFGGADCYGNKDCNPIKNVKSGEKYSLECADGWNRFNTDYISHKDVKGPSPEDAIQCGNKWP